MKHTPGPWRIAIWPRQDEDAYCSNVHIMQDTGNPAQTEKLIADVHMWAGLKSQLSETRANATLLARAPDLLKVCQKVRDVLSVGMAYRDVKLDGEAWRSLTDAICRATAAPAAKDVTNGNK